MPPCSDGGSAELSPFLQLCFPPATQGEGKTEEMRKERETCASPAPAAPPWLMSPHTPPGLSGIARHRAGACTGGGAVLCSLLDQECVWDKLAQAGFKDLPWDHVSYQIWHRVPGPQAHSTAQVTVISVAGWSCLEATAF